MPSIPKRAQTEGSKTFEPDAFFEAWSKQEIQPPYDNDFRKFILKAFALDASDTYGYRATAEVTLLQAQKYVEFGAQGGLHRWYVDSEGNERSPPAVDIAAYTDIFRSTTNTASSLRGFHSNAKKSSVRADVAQHLLSLYKPIPQEQKVVVPKSKTHVNPYIDVWAWSNQNLQWTGPEESTVKIHHSHPILPVLFHHFGCVCPSYEALETIRQIAGERPIADVGSGNGFWTYMLRRMKVGKRGLEVVAIDNGISEWRTMWIPDTVETDGVKWLQQQKGAKEHVLLLVYPQVGLEFTSKTIKAYQGSTIVIAGSQNANGFTAFREPLVAWFSREMPMWDMMCRIPLPSFAGKDEALFVFEKRESS